MSTIASSDGTILDTNFKNSKLCGAQLVENLSDLCAHWRIVAVQDTSYATLWVWNLNGYRSDPSSSFIHARDDGLISTVQGRLEDGTLALYARLTTGNRLPDVYTVEDVVDQPSPEGSDTPEDLDEGNGISDKDFEL